MLTAVCVLMGTAVCLAIGITGIIALRSISNDAYKQYEEAKNEGYQIEIKSQVQSVLAMLQAEYEKASSGQMSEEDAKKEAAEIVRAMRYRDDGSGYFWIDGTDYTLVMHPILTDQEGTNRYELEDQNGVMITQEIIKVCQSSEGGGYNEFYFSSGAGAWCTTLQIHGDGSFEGQYHDSDMGSHGEGYPNGTVYQSNFSGQFTTPVKVNDYTYSMQIARMDYEQETGSEEIRDGVLYSFTDAYGLEEAQDILIYLPGTPLSDLSEEFLIWMNGYDLTENGDIC